MLSVNFVAYMLQVDLHNQSAKKLYCNWIATEPLPAYTTITYSIIIPLVTSICTVATDPQDMPPTSSTHTYIIH